MGMWRQFESSKKNCARRQNGRRWLAVASAPSLLWGAVWGLAFGNVGFYVGAGKRGTRREYAAQAACCVASPCPSNAQR